VRPRRLFGFDGTAGGAPDSDTVLTDLGSVGHPLATAPRLLGESGKQNLQGSSVLFPRVLTARIVMGKMLARGASGTFWREGELSTTLMPAAWSGEAIVAFPLGSATTMNVSARSNLSSISSVLGA